jgi:moderate conductance mechanosensitive channel
MMMKGKYSRMIVVLFAILVLSNSGVIAARAQDAQQDTTTADEVKPDEKTQAQLEEEARIKAEAEAAKAEAETAKAEAEAAKVEAEKAKKEAELHKKEAELEQKKLEAELKETQATKQDAAMVKKTAKSSDEVKKASERTKQEEKEDQIARERAAATQEKMLAAQRKAELAEEQMALAQERLSLAMERLKGQAAQKGLGHRLIESSGIIFTGLVLLLIMKMGGKHIEKRLTKKDVIRESELTLQIKTVVKLFNWLGTIVITILVVYMVLESHGMDVAPLLAGAGIVGLAFGFGGQYLIRDLINGLFILIEGQFRINDVVKIGEYGGLVEDINLRITTLRDLEGRVIIIPNGEIKTVVNFTREYAQALLNVGVAYKENVDRVMAVIKEIGHEMRQDTYFSRLILAELEMLGVDDFADSAVIIKFRIKTLPIKQWEVMREFRRRLKNRFDELGIEIPFPHRTMYWGAGSDNRWMKDVAEKLVAGK